MKQVYQKVLVVTSDVGLVDRLGKILSPDGLELHHVWSLSEGNVLDTRERFDVVLLHVGKPDSQGFSRFIRANLELGRPALIVLAEYHDGEAMAECLRLGAQDFVSIENMETSLIEQRIHHAIERHRYCQDRLGSMGMKLLHAEERQRHRFAEDLHDQLGHNLAELRLKLEEMSQTSLDPAQVGALGEARDLVDNAIRFTRTVTYGLGSLLITEAGLVPAIEWLLDEMRKCHDMRFELRDDGLRKPLEMNMCALLYQAVRELLINVVKHSSASTATVSATKCKHLVYMDIEDDGVGFDDQTGYPSTGFGLHSIRERMEFMGGFMFIDSNPGKGTRVRLAAPLPREKPSTPGRRPR
jgi:signal transduction histidine kinase